MKSFKDWLIINESKGVIFPEDIRKKLYDIAKKAVDILINLDTQEVAPEGELFKYVDKIVFDDPYMKKQRDYAIYAAKFGEKHKDYGSRGYQQAWSKNPHLVVTTQVLLNAMQRGKFNLPVNHVTGKPDYRAGDIINKIYLDNYQENINRVFNTLAHELTHAYDPTLSKGYRNTSGAPEDWVKFASAADDYEKKKSIIQSLIDTTGIGRIFGRENPSEKYAKFLQASKKTKLTPYYHSKDKSEDEYNKYFEQEPEFLANVSSYANSIINAAEDAIANDDPNTLAIKRFFVFKDLLDKIRTGKSAREEVNPLIKEKKFALIQSYLERYKTKNPKFYRKYQQIISNAALQAYKLIDDHITKNKLGDKVNKDVNAHHYLALVRPEIIKMLKSNNITIKNAGSSDIWSNLGTGKERYMYSDFQQWSLEKNGTEFVIEFNVQKLANPRDIEFNVKTLDENKNFRIVNKVRGIKALELFIQNRL